MIKKRRYIPTNRRPQFVTDLVICLSKIKTRNAILYKITLQQYN